MRCTHCGAIIPDDQVVCPRCGAEVQIVPDYNPLDDVLTREVKGSVEGATRQIQTDDIRRYRRGRGEQTETPNAYSETGYSGITPYPSAEKTGSSETKEEKSAYYTVSAACTDCSRSLSCLSKFLYFHG